MSWIINEIDAGIIKTIVTVIGGGLVSVVLTILTNKRYSDSLVLKEEESKREFLTAKKKIETDITEMFATILEQETKGRDKEREKRRNAEDDLSKLRAKLSTMDDKIKEINARLDSEEKRTKKIEAAYVSFSAAILAGAWLLHNQVVDIGVEPDWIPPKNAPSIKDILEKK